MIMHETGRKYVILEYHNKIEEVQSYINDRRSRDKWTVVSVSSPYPNYFIVTYDVPR